MLSKKNKLQVKHFEELIDPIYEKLYKFIFCILRNKHLSEDAMQNTLLKAYCHLSELNDNGRFNSWVFTIAKNESMNILRSYKRELVKDFDDSDMQLNEDMDFTDDIVLNDEIREFIIEVIKSFKPEDRDIVILRYYNDLTLIEISQILNINYNTVRTRHRYIKKRIYKELKSNGLI